MNSKDNKIINIAVQFINVNDYKIKIYSASEINID
tara:strand:- start:2803 stop:2907 length:105 start_codon:yes stop_codon:yes gene_type:complete